MSSGIASRVRVALMLGVLAASLTACGSGMSANSSITPPSVVPSARPTETLVVATSPAAKAVKPSRSPTAKPTSKPATASERLCGITPHRLTTTVAAVAARGVAQKVTMCTYPYKFEDGGFDGPVIATSAEPSTVRAYLRTTNAKNADDGCTADLPAQRQLLFAYADGSRAYLALYFPASCQSFDGRGNDINYMSDRSRAYFHDLIQVESRSR